MRNENQSIGIVVPEEEEEKRMVFLCLEDSSIVDDIHRYWKI